MDDYFELQTAQKLFKLKLKLVIADLYMAFKDHISFASDLAANFGSIQNYVRDCAALHRNQLRKCGFVPMPYFHSEINE